MPHSKAVLEGNALAQLIHLGYLSVLTALFAVHNRCIERLIY